MIHQTDLLDPTSVYRLNDEERRVVDGAQNAGHGPRHLNTERGSAGAMQQVVDASALKACECGAPGGVGDISDGRSSLRDVFDDISRRLAREGWVR
jgi:hypothetical protein